MPAPRQLWNWLACTHLGRLKPNYDESEGAQGTAGVHACTHNRAKRQGAKLRVRVGGIKFQWSLFIHWGVRAY